MQLKDEVGMCQDGLDRGRPTGGSSGVHSPLSFAVCRKLLDRSTDQSSRWALYKTEEPRSMGAQMFRANCRPLDP